MNIYWSLRNVPELAPLAPAERKRVHEACLRRYFWRAPVTRRSLIAYLVLVFSPVAVVSLTFSVAQAFGFSVPLWLSVAAIAVGGVCGRFVFSRIAVAHLRPFYSDYLQNEMRHEAA